MKVAVLLMCAGSSTRFGRDKLLEKIGEKTVLQTNLDNINRCSKIDEIVVVCKSKYEKLQSKKPLSFVEGGNSRSESVKKGLANLDCDIVLIHDGARPFASAKIFEKCIEYVKIYGSAIASINVVDTIKKVDNQKSIETLNRGSLRAIQTPQGFFLKEIRMAYDKLGNISMTDDSAVYDQFIRPSICFEGSAANIKITYAEDVRRRNF